MLRKVKRPFLFWRGSLVASGVALIAATYGLVRLAFGLHLPAMSAELGVDTAAAGLISAAGSIVYAVAALAGFLAAERHPRLLVVVATSTAGGGAIGIACATGAASLALAAAIASTGAGLASPALVRIIARAFAERDASTPQAIVNAGTGPGLAIAGLIALAFAADWRWCWAIAAGATLAGGIAVLATDRAGRAAPRDRSAATSDATHLPPREWWAPHRHGVVASVLLGVGAAAIWNYGRVAMVDAGASDAVSAMAWVLLGCGGAAVIATSRPLRRLQPRQLWAIGSTLVAVSTLALGTAPSHPVIAAGACTLFGWAYVAASGALIGWTTQIDPSYAAAGTALLFVTFMVGQAIGAAALGALLPLGGPTVGFAAAALISLVAGASLTSPSRARGAVEITSQRLGKRVGF